MKKISIILLFSLVARCDYINPKKVDSEKLLEDKRETIDWNDIDFYPKFTTCEESIKKEESKACFEKTLTNHINTYLKNQNILVKSNVNDTLILEVFISKKGIIDIKKINSKKETRQYIPMLDSLFNESLKTLPALFPAIKRDHQVNSSFTLPIFISME